MENSVSFREVDIKKCTYIERRIKNIKSNLMLVNKNK